ncbi:MAG: peptidoglycan-binding protein [Clostridia bacterium]|nr:peptidoglycan-binding protein [Clostridia bacterium]
MAYDINDKRSAVREVQRYLRGIARTDGDMTKVYPDGIYDENTAKAVSEFQRKHGLEATGAVDKKTFDALYKGYLEAEAESEPPEKIDVFGCRLADGRMSLGEEFDSVYILQVMLCLLAEPYGFEPAAINGCYDEMTENAVMSFQKIHGLPQTGSVDKATWNELAGAYNRYIRKEM